MATGKVVQIIGPVVDVEFPPEQLPDIYNAVEIPTDAQGPGGGSEGTAGNLGRLVVEVQQHLGNNWVRCVAMGSTDGMKRGMPAIDRTT